MHTRRKHIPFSLIAALLLALVAVVAYPWLYMLGAGRLWDKAEREVHLLPTNFVGPVVILLNDPNASSTEREDGARLFRIPMGTPHSLTY